MTTSNQRRKLAKARNVLAEQRRALSPSDCKTISKMPSEPVAKGPTKGSGRAFHRWTSNQTFKSRTWVRKGL